MPAAEVVALKDLAVTAGIPAADTAALLADYRFAKDSASACSHPHC